MSITIGLKLAIDGEREFKQALSEINRSFKVLGSEMKLADSNFKRNNDAVTDSAEKQRVLRKEIDLQKIRKVHSKDWRRSLQEYGCLSISVLSNCEQNGRALLELLAGLDTISVPITKYAEIFNGIHTSAERPSPVYWFASQEIVSKNDTHIEIMKDNQHFSIEKEILKPFFKLTKKAEGSLNS